MPVILYTNTEQNRYLLTLPGIFRAVVVPDKDLFHIRGWVFFIPFRFNPFKPSKKEKEKKALEKKTKKKKRGFLRSGNIKTMKGALRALRVKRLEADVDTDDFTLNAWLVPIFSAVNGQNIRLQVNFEGHQSLLLDLRVTLGTLLWTIIKMKYNSRINQ